MAYSEEFATDLLMRYDVGRCLTERNYLIDLTIVLRKGSMTTERET